GLHLLGTVWNIVMGLVPGFNALAGTSSILNRAVVDNSADVCGYVQDWICPYISRHLLSLNPLLACCRRYSRGER
ncbi:DUF4765 family protein, partial [Salmonella enterica]|nr:DUF4765 family protein [Salmonella enterica subsp. enterica serovar Braenderup]